MKDTVKLLRKWTSCFLKVNYDLGAKELRAQIWKIDCGFVLERYGELNMDKFSSCFTGTHGVKMSLFSFDEDMSPVDVIKKMKNVQYRQAELREFLAFSVKCLEEKLRRKLIVILGTKWRCEKDKKSLMHAVLRKKILRPAYYYKNRYGKNSRPRKWPKGTLFLGVHEPSL